MHTNFVSSTYVAARDERIKEAVKLFDECPEQVTCANTRKSGGRIVLGAHGALMIAAFAMIASQLAGFLIFWFGVGAMFVGFERLLRGERMADRAFVVCVNVIDVSRPELIATMKRYEHERAKERWSSDTI